MTFEILLLIVIILIGGFALSAGSLYASFISRADKGSDATVGFGFLSLALFIGAIVSTITILYNVGAWK